MPGIPVITRGPPAGVTPLPDGPRRVLIAEDEHLIAAEMVRMVTQFGYETVGPYADGESALKGCGNATPDLALLDIRMPGIDGLELARRIYSEFAIPTVIVSAFSDPECISRAQSSGVFGYLLKPVDKNQLGAAVAVAWSRYKSLLDALAETDDLRRRLEGRQIIEKAKWILVSRKGISEPDAMKQLQKRARDSRQNLAAVAEAVLKADGVL